ncbi:MULTISPECIES: trypsin-like peptidase domain-containing protein [Methylomonas]|uniref:trypsin-like peptidase domain-containing protein n=1 Tax=Methylomonas TaxID=416 RepID=UPI0007C949F9|nr:MULTISPECIES: trypsin-like peptidase domain-containing protein [Methylomonas]ANE54534.1 hypothetical protein AYM39_04580 [Methylomonas sp. DH-1]ATG89186.1 hypothetical protein MKLM6_0919 [Methylomonas koyamae]
MQKIIIKHLAGSKANQTDGYELPIQELIFGRETNCQVMFDPEKDDLVSRTHCKITVQNENQFWLTDLNSRNGTLVNNAKITAPQQIYAGDVVELGKGGPKFVFDLDPRPPAAAKATRFGDAPSPVAATREVRVEPSLDALAGIPKTSATNVSAENAEPPRTIGRNTVERLITQAETNSRKKMINIGAGIIGVIVAISGFLAFQNYQSKAELQSELDRSKVEQGKQIAELNANKALSSSDIFKSFGNATVFIESSWKLIHIPTGKQIFQKAGCVTKAGKCITESRPWYIYIDGTVEPFLDIDSGLPIGESGSGSGFVVEPGGFILTNRHVAASWLTQNRNFSFPGFLVVCGDENCSKHEIAELRYEKDNKYIASLNSWVPSKSKMLGKKPLHGKIVEGRNDYLDVTFPKTGLRIPAHLVRVSDSADVALIKVDVPQSLPVVQMSSEDAVTAGDAITVMGYPGVSPDVAVKMSSQDPFNREGEWRQIPDPTVTGGNIGKVIQGSATTMSDSVNGYFSEMGDVYQLTVNATGSGNSGGPVFNDKGHVIGIFTSKRTDNSGTVISFAVPIRHGQEIMGVHKLVQ